MATTQGTDTTAATFEQYRSELTGYCYRMLGAISDAEDAVQETMVRAWRAHDRFEGRSSLRSWLYRIAHNVCMDSLNGRNRRARPMDMVSVGSSDDDVPAPLPEHVWLQPAPDGRVLRAESDPGELAAERHSIRLAFVAALQHLPTRQRAVLILREVLRWHADEVAELLDTSVASVNSALQRARARLAAANLSDTDAFDPTDEAQRQLLDRYLDAFERYDLDALVALLHNEVVQSMPPIPLWLQGATEVKAWMLGTGSGCRGSRVLPAPAANGMPAFGQYRPPTAAGEPYRPWALQVLEISEGEIVGLNFFLDTDTLFPLFGLPPHLDP
ncbi:MAG: sigma-70 family RNA polymerase sigma factor [Acidimicrobiales bacterium]